MKQTTICFLIKDEQVLLGMKKRGFGAGKWNGFGGKVQEGESVAAAAIREIKEEIGVTVEVKDLVLAGTLEFTYSDNGEWNQTSSVFIVRQWSGEAAESDEMKPRWCAKDALPFDQMWIDDPHWLPLVLSGKTIKGKFLFDEKGGTMINFAVSEVHP